jgi:hypothetical protein
MYTNHSFMFEVTLVRDDCSGKRILVLEAGDLLVDVLIFLNGLTRGDRLDEEAPTHAHVLLLHDAEGDKFW